MKRNLIWLVYTLLFVLIAAYILSTGCTSSSTGPDDTATPEITSIYPQRGQVGSNVIIHGLNFGNTADSVKFNGVPAPIVSWSDTLIKAEVPQDATPGDIYVKKGRLISNGIPFIVENLKITSVSPARLFPGSAISINGRNFGETAGTVLIDEINATIAFWSDTLIVAVVPDECSRGEIEVRSGELVSNIVRIGIYSISIDSVEPSIAFIGEEVNVFGNFYHFVDGYVKFNDVIAEIISQSDTLIVVIVPDGSTSGNVVVEVDGYASNGVYFHVRKMTIIALEPTSGLSGDEIMIHGQDFGDESGNVTFTGINAEILTWSDTLIMAKVPDGASSGDVMVEVDGYYSNGVYFFVGLMTIISLEPAKGFPGSHVSIKGYGFGSEQGNVRLDGIDTEIQLWSDTLIAIIAPLAAASGEIVVESNGYFSNGVFFHVRVLTITGIEPSSAFVGDNIKIRGLDFGEEQGVVKFTGRTATITEWSDTLIIAIVPDGVSSGDVVIDVDGHYSNGIFFHVRQMTINNLQPTMGLPGDTVLIHGYDFGVEAGLVTFSETAANIQSWSDTLIEVVVPEITSSGDVMVEFEGHSSNTYYFIVIPQGSILGFLADMQTVEVDFRGYNRYEQSLDGYGESMDFFDTIWRYNSINIEGNDIEWNILNFSVEYQSSYHGDFEWSSQKLKIYGDVSEDGEEIINLSASYENSLGGSHFNYYGKIWLNLGGILVDSISYDYIGFSICGPESKEIIQSIGDYSRDNNFHEDEVFEETYLSTDWQNSEYPPEITVIFRRE